LFFAGQNHVHVQIIASEDEQALITTNPTQRQQRKNDDFMTNNYADPNQMF
jgi:hypothetical protein